MTASGAGRVPRRAGRHLLIVGATGSGKTVSARRWLLARILADGVGALVLDPKGDPDLESDLRAGARVARRPFVLFDPRDPHTDRWNPLWSEDTGAVVSRLVAPLQSAEGNARYYADLLQIHLGIVAEALRAAGHWPANLPLLLDAAQLHAYDRLLELARAGGAERSLIARLREHRLVIADATGRRDLIGGTTRLRVIAGETWRTTLTPDPARGAVTLPAAMASGAVVLLRSGEPVVVLWMSKYNPPPSLIDGGIFACGHGRAPHGQASRWERADGREKARAAAPSLRWR